MDSYPASKVGGGRRGGKRTALASAEERGFGPKEDDCRSRKNIIKHLQILGAPVCLKVMDLVKNSRGEVECPHCDYSHKKNGGALQQHYLKHFKGRFPCGQCGDSFHLATEFRNHFLWKCLDCGKAVKNGRYGLALHKKSKHQKDKRFRPTRRIKRARMGDKRPLVVAEVEQV